MTHTNASHQRIDALETRTPIQGVMARRLMGDKVMVQHVHVSKGAAAPMHSHENEQVMMVVEGSFRMTVEDNSGETRVFDMQPGEILHLPSNCPHGGEAIEDCVIIDIFSPPSETTGIDTNG